MPRSCSPRRWRARSITSRTSFTPAVTALSCSNARRVVPATASANVVLPVPGGPQKIALAEAVLLDEATQRPARTDELVLTDDVVDRSWSQPGGERRLGAQPLLGGGGEQVGHSVLSTRS